MSYKKSAIIRTTSDGSAKDVSGISAYAGEDEKLYLPGTTFSATNSTEKNGVILIDAKEVPGNRPSGEKIPKGSINMSNCVITNTSDKPVKLTRDMAFRAGKLGFTDISETAMKKVTDDNGLPIISSRIDENKPSLVDLKHGLKTGDITQESDGYRKKDGSKFTFNEASKNTFFRNVITKRGSISNSEKNDLHRYTTSDGFEMNRVLREGKTTNVDRLDSILGASSALNKMKPYKGRTYRGLYSTRSEKVRDSYERGNYREDGFTSTSSTRKVGNQFAGFPFSHNESSLKRMERNFDRRNNSGGGCSMM